MPSPGRVKERREKKVARKEADSIKRNPARVQPKRIFFVVSEGQATEPDYFKYIAREIRDRVAILISPDHGGPLTVVQHAVSSKTRIEKDADPNARYDEIWAVFDVDEHPNIPAARDLARAHGIQLAISNPCFELWLLLHFRDQNADIHRHDAHAASKAYLQGYEKHLDAQMLDLLRERVAYAVERGKALCREAERFDDPGRNPTSTVHKLMSRLLPKSALTRLDDALASKREKTPKKTKKAKQ